MKKAQSISINTIVVAAIALVVMVLVVMIFTGNITKFRKNANDCGANSGKCINANDITELCSGEYQRVRNDYTCYTLKGEPDKTKACCLST